MSLKREAWDHPKFKALGRDLNLPPCYIVGILECLWLITGAKLPRGDIGRWPNDEIASAIGYPGDPDQLVAALIKRRLLDEIPDGRLYIHDWHDHCDQAVKRKLARWGKTFANGMAATWMTKTHQHPDMTSHEQPPLVTTIPPEPEPEPEPEPVVVKKLETSTTNERRSPPNAVSDFPKTHSAISARFPTADVMLTMQVVQESVRSFLSCDSPKISMPTDADIASAVEVASKGSTKQTSPGLFLKTVPTVISNWAKHGRNGAAKRRHNPTDEEIFAKV